MELLVEGIELNTTFALLAFPLVLLLVLLPLLAMLKSPLPVMVLPLVGVLLLMWWKLEGNILMSIDGFDCMSTLCRMEFLLLPKWYAVSSEIEFSLGKLL